MADPISLFPIVVTKSDSFDRFWSVYPRRKDKLDAQRAWLKALKVATAEEIIVGAMRYARTAVEPFIKLPATFLNKGSWMDEEAAVAPVESSYDRREALRASAAKGNRFSADLLKRDYNE